MRAEPRVGILISGRGSNMMALVEAAAGAHYTVALVASDRPEAAGLGWAAAQGLRCFALSPRGIGKPAFEAQLDAALRDAGVEVIALAGYMRLLSDDFVARWRGRIVNIHPSLLPKYKGLDTHARAIAANDAVAGCSVHLVTEELDGGAVLGQATVPVLPGDDADTLAARVLAAEHHLYPQILARYLMTDPSHRIRTAALALPDTTEAEGVFSVGDAPFAILRDGTLRVVAAAEGGTDWTTLAIDADADWAAIEDRIARGWELVAPQGLLEAGGR